MHLYWNIFYLLLTTMSIQPHLLYSAPYCNDHEYENECTEHHFFSDEYYMPKR